MRKDTITISEKEYQKLLEKALRYEYLFQILKEKDDIFAPSPTREVKEVVRSFKATGLYSSQFLKGLEKGLRRSSYFKK